MADLTIGYRVPEPILTIANRLLPMTGVDATASRSVRADGDPPAWHVAPAGGVAATTAEVVRAVKHRHRLTGVVAPLDRHAEITRGTLGVGHSSRSTMSTPSATTTCRCSAPRR